MGKRRTHLKNARKRLKRRIYAQLSEEFQKSTSTSKENEERELMQLEENNLKSHEKWLQANALSDAAFEKRQRIIQERKRLMDDIRQQMEQETLENEMRERQDREISEQLLHARREIEHKKWAEGINQLTEEQKKVMLCRFYSLTGACRFGDQCSRIHAPPPQSARIVLIPSMHMVGVKSHRDGDDNLELDESEMRNDYHRFYFDALDELSKFGGIVRLTTSCNTAKQLQGNVYVEYQTSDQAKVACDGLHMRWYAGKQLAPSITSITNWNDSICGLFVRKRCVRGGDCNYIHPFTNPVETPRLVYRSPERNKEKETKRRRSPSPKRENLTQNRRHVGSKSVRSDMIYW